MKKLYLSLLATCLGFGANASDFKVDGINYAILTDSTVAVDEGAYEGDIIIPETVTYDGVTYTVTEIGERAFEMTDVETVEIPNTVTTIGDWAFLDCWELTSINVPNSVTYLGFYVFGCCYSLEEVTLSNSITYIDDSAFRECTSLVEIEIPEGVVEIKEDAFLGCASLEKVILPSTLTTLGDDIFYECPALESIELPDGLKDLGYGMFTRCTSLREVKLPKYLEVLSASTFYYCKSLESIDIPETVTTIGGSAFYGASNLMTINCNAVTPPTILRKMSFDDKSYENAIVKVPAESVAAYKAAEFWSDFANIESNGTSGINSVISGSEPFTVTGTAIAFEAGVKSVEIFNASASQVYSSSDASNAVVNLSKGIYLINVDGKSYKAIIK